MEKLTEELLEFLEKCHSSFHVVYELKKQLQSAGYTELREDSRWDLRKGGGYFVIRNSSSLMAFRMPESGAAGAHIAAVHSDSPVFKLKPNPELPGGGDTIRLNVEKYGGMLTAPWFDRPLTVGGRILVCEGEKIREQLVYVDRDLLLIPSLAIHMDREANEKAHGNVQTELLPLFGNMEDLRSREESGNSRKESGTAWKGALIRMIAAEAGIAPESILGADLFLTAREKPAVWGLSGEYISAQRLDDLACCYSIFRGFLSSGEEKAGDSRPFLPVFCVFDNEETGSRTGKGAESDFLSGNLRRICEKLGFTEEDYRMFLARSFMISADNAHAVHPNYPEKADPVNRPRMNQGIVLKHHANQKYTTDGISAAVIRSLCFRHEIPLQDFSSRSDMASGSTLGNISNTKVSMYTADIGLAQLSMHSCYETAGSEDPKWLFRLLEVFYEETLPEIEIVSWTR